MDLAKFLDWVGNEWEHATKTLSEISRSVSPFELQSYQRRLNDYFDKMIATRTWPLHPNEMRALGRERQRIDDATALYKRFLKPDEPDRYKVLMLGSHHVVNLMNEAKVTVFCNGPYTLAVRDKFLRMLRVSRQFEAFKK